MKRGEKNRKRNAKKRERRKWLALSGAMKELTGAMNSLSETTSELDRKSRGDG